MDNVIVSPHMCGDFYESFEVMVGYFLDNLRRFRNSEPLLNVVDKTSGFVVD